VRDTVIRTYYPVPVQDLASGPSGKKVYCACPDSLNVYETGNDTLVAAIPWESAGNIFLCVPGVEKVYCSRDGTNQVLVVDARADSIITRIPTPWPRALAYDRPTGLVYCARPEAGEVMLIDSRTDSIVDSLSPCTRPESFTMSPAHGRVYVGNGGNSFIPVIRSALPGVGSSTSIVPSERIPCARIVAREMPLVVAGRSALLDPTGRKVLDLKPGANDVRHLAPGVYFVREASGVKREASSVRKVVLTE
jgi:DNA-binding beta-propeller fold protein YncE